MIVLVFDVVMCRVDNNVHKHCDCCTATRSLLGSMRGWRPLIEVLSQLKFRDRPTAGVGPVQGREGSCPPDLKFAMHVLRFQDHPHGGGVGLVQAGGGVTPPRPKFAMRQPKSEVRRYESGVNP